MHSFLLVLLFLFSAALSENGDIVCNDSIDYHQFPHITFKTFVDIGYNIVNHQVYEFNIDRIYYIEGEDMGKPFRGFGIHLGSYVKKLPQSRPYYRSFQYIYLTELLLYCSALPVAILYSRKLKREVGADPDRPNGFLGFMVGLAFSTTGIIPHFIKRIPLRRSLIIYNKTTDYCDPGP